MLSILEHLKSLNNIPVYDVRDKAFAVYGRILTGYDFSGMIEYMRNRTEIPPAGSVYIASDPELEKDPLCSGLRDILYGGMNIQAGYCNGRNTSLNGLEYHKGSEINVAVTDMVLLLGHLWDMRDNFFDTRQVQAFYLEAGTAIELYQTSLHLAPCRTDDEGFKGIVILPRGTNTPLDDDRITAGTAEDSENRLLLMKNKWIIAHLEWKKLTDKGVFPGLRGINIEFRYKD